MLFISALVCNLILLKYFLISMNSFLKSTKGQSVIEYFMLMIVAVVVLIVALQPRGFVASGINQKIIIEEGALDEYSRCVRFCGNEPCPPMCPNGCCEPGEDETTCQQDCAGCVPVSCDFEHCGVIADGCGQFIECPDCGCEKSLLKLLLICMTHFHGLRMER